MFLMLPAAQWGFLFHGRDQRLSQPSPGPSIQAAGLGKRFQYSLYESADPRFFALSRSCNIEKLDPVLVDEFKQRHFRGDRLSIATFQNRQGVKIRAIGTMGCRPEMFLSIGSPQVSRTTSAASCHRAWRQRYNASGAWRPSFRQMRLGKPASV